MGSKVAGKQAQARAQLNADLAKLRVAAKTEHRYTQKGNGPINAAEETFLLHVSQETLPVKERSRFIDRAAAIVAPRCYLCFQALEASRPTGATAKLPCD